MKTNSANFASLSELSTIWCLILILMICILIYDSDILFFPNRIVFNLSHTLNCLCFIYLKTSKMEVYKVVNLIANNTL